MREVVTVQLGEYANYLGSHFWNLQDEAVAQLTDAGRQELNPHIFLREAVHGSNISFSPRLQILDLSGAFGSLNMAAGYTLHRQRDDNAAGSHVSPGADLLWHGTNRRYEKPQIPMNTFLDSLADEDAFPAQGSPEEPAKPGLCPDVGELAEDGASPDFGLDSNVRYWTDYLKAKLHPRTCRSIPGVHHGVNDFALFGSGVAAASGNLLSETFDDLRYFIECCDSFGGLVVICDVHGGFSGFAERYLAHISEELGASPPIAVYGASSPPPASPSTSSQSLQTEMTQRLFNEALLFSATAEYSTQYIPLRGARTMNFQYMHPSLSNPFQTSSALAVGMDVALTPLKYLESRVSLTGLLDSMRPAPFANLSSLALAMPLPGRLSILRSALHELSGMVRLSLAQAQSGPVTSAGISDNPNPPIPLPTREVVCARGVSLDAEIFCRVDTRIAVPVPFPRFFDRRVDMQGHILPLAMASKRPRLCEVGELSALTSAYVDVQEAHLFLSDVGSSLDRAARTPAAVHAVLEAATIREAADSIHGLAADYRTL
jgi:Misato Segment II tubulin-like domain/Tubulin domain